MNAFVALAAAFQFASPAWLATMLTAPVPLNVRFVPPEIEAGPAPTANDTSSPLVAVAASPTASVVTLSPIAGKLIVWSAFAAATVAVAAVAKYRSSWAFVATSVIVPLPAVTAKFVPPAIIPGPAVTA